MKPKYFANLAAFVLSLVLVLFFVGTALGQSTNRPVLSITSQRVPQISVQGQSGATYQLQCNSNLVSANWQVLSNFTLSSSLFSMADPGATAAGIRMYRALLLALGGADYAPTNLTAAEIFQFSPQSGGFNVTDTLVLNSPTSGLFLQSGGAGNPLYSLVTVSYKVFGPYLAQMSIIVPPGSGYPSSQTNSYMLAFSGTGGGFFQETNGVAMSTVGGFLLSQSLVGQQLAPSQLTGGEAYHLSATNSFSTNLTTLVINSPTSGMLEQFGNSPGAGITPVGINYLPLGPLTCQLQVIMPVGSGNPSPQTNLYYLVYSSGNVGYFEGVSASLISTLGPFTRDPSLIGRQFTTSQLTGGEIYNLFATNSYPTNVTTLVVNSPTNGMLEQFGNLTGAAITPVGISYLALGPLACQLQVSIPAGNGSPSAQTNVYYVVYSSTNAGSFESVSSSAITAFGPLTHDLSLLGHSLAASQLTVGEIYDLLATNMTPTNLTTLVVNSSTSGTLEQFGNSAGIDITPVSLTYLWLGPLSCQFQVVIPAGNGFPSTQTNLYYLVYAATNTGSFGSPGAIFTFGTFVRDTSLVGQQFTASQLSGGEVYNLFATNSFATNQTTLVINSATTGMLEQFANTIPGAGIAPVEVSYFPLGPLSCQLQVIIPAGNGNPSVQTNTYFLVYSSNTAGSYEGFSSSTISTLGTFVHDRSLVGQQLAPAQPAAEEVYNLFATNTFPTNLTTLVINSPNTGTLEQISSFSASGINSVNVTYLLLGPLSCQFQAVIPAGNGYPSPQTNVYYLVYSAANAGSFGGSSSTASSSFGTFTRDLSLVGKQIAPLQLNSGEVFNLLSSSGISSLSILALNSASTGELISTVNSPGGDISPVSVSYLLLGPLGCQFQVVIPAGKGNPSPQTNAYYLTFSTANAGYFQVLSGTPASGLGTFSCDLSLAGQQVAPTQLTTGESYEFTATNGPSVNVDDLIVNSATNGILFIQDNNTDAGLYPNVADQYLKLGAVTGQIQTVIPPTPPVSTPQTNTYLLVYTTGTAGQYQQTSGSGITTLGQFIRSPGP